MEKLYTFFLILALGNVTASQMVNLNGPKYVRTNNSLLLTCTSDSVPASQSAEFLVNGQTYRNINYFENNCYIGSVLCSNDSDSCRCSSDAKSYMTSYQPTKMETNVKFICSMKFGDGELSTIEDTILVEIIDLPTIQLDEMVQCQTTKKVTLSCTIKSGRTSFEFTNWIHTINGQFIRSMEPILVANSSLLFIQSCSYKDLGDYTCTARHKDKHHKIVNKTATLLLLGAPEIVNTNILVDGMRTTLSIWAYTDGILNKTVWFFVDKLIPNTTRSIHTTFIRNKSLQIYESHTDFHIWEINLTLINAQRGQYCAVLHNDCGETNHTINVQGAIFSFHRNSLISTLAFIIIGIILIAAVGWARIIKRNCAFSTSTNMIAIYHAAVPPEPVIQTYSTTDVQYDDCIIGYQSRNYYLNALDDDNFTGDNEYQRNKSCHYEEIL